ncbi:membrane protein insertion efficiency factor YidD [Notoacmeibacter sp. MSK16QG-6]|uniref:membrane protein insertion efficiency factor YidD n=1 Tax=Notoacmeibacter sp. MSK16QG-6 TaxID=2957982 RepID=UPI0020A190E3|nr:membrane protein insertion efficiency factor YidD [Notoacmeibacter sp. MSK16QG-6]
MTTNAGRNYQGHWPKTPARVFGTGLVRLYQLTLSGFVGQGCRHQPTCSEYAYEAIARHGLIRGGWLGARRVFQCRPGGTHGYDPVPDK